MRVVPHVFIALTLFSLSCKKDLERDNYHDLKGSDFQDITITNSAIVVGGYPSAGSRMVVSAGEFYTVLTVKNAGTQTLNGVGILIKDKDGKVIREYNNMVSAIVPGQEIKLSKAIKMPVYSGSTTITFKDADGKTWDKEVTYQTAYPSNYLEINEMDLIYESNPDGKINPGETVRFQLMLSNQEANQSWDIEAITFNQLGPYITSAYLSSGILPYTHYFGNAREEYLDGVITMTVRNDAPIGSLYFMTVAYAGFSGSTYETNELSFTISQ